MLQYLLQGFLLGLAYVAPIGMQNLYVINTAIKMSRVRAYQVAFITIFFDISLALACFFGVGILLEKLPILRGIVLLVGSLIVLYIGIGLVRSQPTIDEEISVDQPLSKIIGVCFVVTWLNPQALIDGSLLLGGFRASLPAAASGTFIAGVALASFTWFTGLATAISSFRRFISTKILRYINIACGIVIIYFGLKLGYTFIQMWL